MNNFRLRKLTTAEEAGKIFNPRRAALGWKPGALDHYGSFAVDDSGSFVGELEGKVISCISVLKYCDDYAFISHWIVDEEYRGKGFGLATWELSFSSAIPTGCNCALSAMEDTAAKYTRHGFKPEWRMRSITIDASGAKHGSSIWVTNKLYYIKSANLVPFEKLVKYDTSVHVYARPKFLKMWISAENCYSYAVLNMEDEVVGYAAVTSAYQAKDGWLIGPLFADNSQIARALYREMAERVAMVDPNSSITAVVPYGGGCNPDTLTIADELSSEKEAKLFRMYTNGIPDDMPLHKIFAVTHVG